MPRPCRDLLRCTAQHLPWGRLRARSPKALRLLVTADSCAAEAGFAAAPASPACCSQRHACSLALPFPLAACCCFPLRRARPALSSPPLTLSAPLACHQPQRSVLERAVADVIPPFQSDKQQGEQPLRTAQVGTRCWRHNRPPAKRRCFPSRLLLCSRRLTRRPSVAGRPRCAGGRRVQPGLDRARRAAAGRPRPPLRGALCCRPHRDDAHGGAPGLLPCSGPGQLGAQGTDGPTSCSAPEILGLNRGACSLALAGGVSAWGRWGLPARQLRTIQHPAPAGNAPLPASLIDFMIIAPLYL